MYFIINNSESSMWTFDYGLLNIALRTAIIYIVVLIGIRISGKREVGQMTPFDLVLLLLIANAVQNAMTGPDTSVTGGVIAATTLLIINGIVSRLVRRNEKFRAVVEGTPTILIHHGKIVTENLKKEQLTPDALSQALREHGVEKVGDVRIAVLEIDGSVSVLRNDEMPTTTRPHRNFRFLGRKTA
jgi:uncharacterized membrane protein YcaP (DUF421 family)